jgi:hypothetical protein
MYRRKLLKKDERKKTTLYEEVQGQKYDAQSQAQDIASWEMPYPEEPPLHLPYSYDHTSTR